MSCLYTYIYIYIYDTCIPLGHWRDYVCIYMCVHIHETLLSHTLWRQPTREPLAINAVVIDPETPLNPFHPLRPLLVQLSSEPWSRSPAGGRLHTRQPDASAVDIEATVGGREGSHGPVCLDEAAPCGPLVSVVDGREEPHRLSLWEGHPLQLHVLEFPYGDVVHVESVSSVR